MQSLDNIGQKSHNRPMNLVNPQPIVYEFPPIRELPTTFDSLEHINDTINLCLRLYNQKTLPINRIEKSMVLRETETGAILKCKTNGCGAYILFTLGNSCYSLFKIETTHEHPVKNTRKGRIPKIKNSEVEECYDELQLLNFKPGEIIEFIRNKFKVSKPHFYGIKFCRNKRENIRNLLMALSKYDHFFFECIDLRELVAHYKMEKIPDSVTKERDIIILVSQRMKQLYHAYHGQYVYFSMFPDIVLETRYTKSLNYQHIGVLYGEDSTGKLTLLFGLVILRKASRLAYLYILEKLFNFLGKYPKVLVTDYDELLPQVIKRLRERCKVPGVLKQHIQMPNSFITSSFQQRISTQFLSILSNQLDRVLRESDHKGYQEKSGKLIEACQFNPIPVQQKISDQVEKFVRENSIINLPPVFIGLALSQYSTAMVLRARILDFFKSPRPMLLAVKAFFEIFQAYPILRFLSPEQIEARLNPPRQSPLKTEKLQLLQVISKQLNASTKIRQVVKSLSEPAALYFYDMLELCFEGEVQLIEEGHLYFYRVEQTQQHSPYVIRKMDILLNGSKEKVWRCDCKMFFKSGIPCWHEIKTCLCEGSDLTVQVNPYWLAESRVPPPPAPPAVNEHDIKHWSQQDSLKEQDFKTRNLSEVVNAPDTKEAPKLDASSFFNYDLNSMEQEQEPVDDQMQKGIGSIMQELDVVEWEMNSDANPGKEKQEKQEIKFEEDAEADEAQEANSLLQNLQFEEQEEQEESLEDQVKFQETEQSSYIPVTNLEEELDDDLAQMNNTSMNSGWPQLNESGVNNLYQSLGQFTSNQQYLQFEEEEEEEEEEKEEEEEEEEEEINR